MLESLREETEGKLQMLLSLRKNGLTSLFKEVRAFKVLSLRPEPPFTGVSGPSGPKIAKKVSKSVSLGVCQGGPENTPKKSKKGQKVPF